MIELITTLSIWAFAFACVVVGVLVIVALFACVIDYLQIQGEH